MTDNKFKTMRLIMDTVDFRARQRLPKPTLAEVRAALAELGVNGAERVTAPQVRWIEDTDEGRKQLDALPDESVIRDSEGRVFERWPQGWLLTGDPGVCTVDDIDLPALVLYTPGDES
jgi:hypothetical protein